MIQNVKRWLDRRINGSPIVVFYDYVKPHYDGGNQFLLALKGEWERRGLAIGVNRVGPNTRSVLFNSYSFSYENLAKVPRKQVRLVHRVDGPIGVYRGADNSIDRKVWEMNRELADATVFQSQYSLDKYAELGHKFKNPVVIPNAVDPRIFFPARRRAVHDKIRIIATSWSDDPHKGAAIYQWLDENLDRSRYSFTFVGRIKAELRNCARIRAVPSEGLAELLRDHDIYLTASEHDPCSNALIEALACGLPAIYRRSGGHSELVGDAGLGFDDHAEIPTLLDELVHDYEDYRVAIQVASIAEVADRYLEQLQPVVTAGGP